MNIAAIIPPHISRGAMRHIALSFVAVVLVAAALGLAIQAAGAGTRHPGYGWPVAPFDRPHPVRGNFGDPRTIFAVPPSPEGVLTGTGTFSFHFGVDISAPDGTRVFAVASGTVSAVSKERTREYVTVDSGGGRSFQYWHIRATVRPGERVEAGKTVLGTIMTSFNHVHFAELQGGQAVNPLLPGHLTPYVDTTMPEIKSISLRASETGRDLLPSFVRGRVLMLAEAYDRRQLPIRGAWNGMSVAPALVTFQLKSLSGRVAARGVAADFRTTIPSNSLFWSYYSRGTYQNMSVFGSHYSWGQPGCFLFKLTRSYFDTRSVPDGVYDVVVIATDIRGNRSSKSMRLTIHNRPGWAGS